MENMYEYTFSRPGDLRIDRDRGILHGVKVLGFHSRNGRRYTSECLSESASLYENAKVNINHVESGVHPRDYRDRIGVLRGVEYRADLGLFGDFYYNPKHPLAEQLLWDAEHSPENVGFSHHVEAETSQEGEGVVVRKIVKVLSVDLVADPATTRGLFESQVVPVSEHPSESLSDRSSLKSEIDSSVSFSSAEATIPSLRVESNESIESNHLLKDESSRLDFPLSESLLSGRRDLVESSDLEPLSRGKRSYRHTRQRLEESESSRKRLEEEVSQLRAELDRKDRELCIRGLLQEQGLSIPLSEDEYGQTLVSEVFLRTLYEASDEYTIRALILDRVRLMRLPSREEMSERERASRFVEEIKR